MSTLTHADDHDHDHKPTGLKRWFFSTNHKDIGTLYLIFALTMFFVGGSMAMIIRAELFQPGLQFVDPQFYNSMVTVHALIMIFGAVMPAGVGLANWMIPLMIGAPDMALPRMNNMSFWILPFAFALLISTLFMEGGGPAGGWTMYPPLVLQTGAAFPFLILAIHFLGVSSIMGAINIIVTVFNMRAPGMTLMKMPLFVWTWVITSFLLVASLPVLAGGVTMLLTDKYFGTSFFNAAGGGDPVLFQHIFWFFGHPEVYILALPAFGIVSQIIPAFSRKPLFGYASMVYATASIAILSFFVWAHHMFTVGLPLKGELFFMYATMMIAVPTGVKVFNWMATMWKGAMTFETPMLFSIAFVILFTIGGFSGLMLLAWDDGGAYALLGPSGCGKTTLLNIISGLLVPSEGQLLFDDEDVTALEPDARNIAQVFQFPVIYDTMTVRDNLSFPLRNRGVDEQVIAQRVAEIAAMLELEPMLDQKAAGLSPPTCLELPRHRPA